MQLTDQVAIITGSARRLGAPQRCVWPAKARAVWWRMSMLPEEAASEIEGLGRRAIAVQTDIAE
jgi:hypothetical protein